ncbi:MAG TPA: hypothetical protein VFT22_08725 [Kofleriaceae bacterium]|nr:hypothetical protein [Kofleriaceae bacterium]
MMWLALAAPVLGACKWTEFDDLEKETWVDSTEKPSIKSSDWGIAVQRGARGPGDGGRLVVIGAGQASYSELVYSAQGEASFPPTAVLLQEQYGIPNIGQQPIVLADPSSDDVSLIVGSDNGVALLTGAMGVLKSYQLFTHAAPDAAVYMLAPGQTRPLPLVAVGENVLGALLPELPTGMPQPTCKLTDTATAGFKAQVRALGAIRSGATDDVLVWDASGKLYRYPSSVFSGCASQDPIASLDTGIKPDAGAQILAIDATHIVLQGQTAGNGFLGLFDAMAMTPVGQGLFSPGLRTAAVLDLGTSKFVAAGVPTMSIDGTTAGGVVLYRVSAAGLDAQPAATLHDAQPETKQSFGRGVAVMPFNGKQVLAIAADNEVFVYFRANLADGTVLYDETRQDR